MTGKWQVQQENGTDVLLQLVDHQNPDRQLENEALNTLNKLLIQLDLKDLKLHIANFKHRVQFTIVLELGICELHTHNRIFLK